MTLCFLGWTDPGRVEEAMAIVSSTTARPVPIRLLATPVGRPPGRPGVIALEAEAPAATDLYFELEPKLVDAGLMRRERRAFWPHVTVARVRSEPSRQGRRGRPRRLERWPAPFPGAEGGEFGAVRLCLYRSTLRPEGSRYEPLATLDLQPAPRAGTDDGDR